MQPQEIPFDPEQYKNSSDKKSGDKNMSTEPAVALENDYHVADISLADWGRREINIEIRRGTIGLEVIGIPQLKEARGQPTTRRCRRCTRSDGGPSRRRRATAT